MTASFPHPTVFIRPMRLDDLEQVQAIDQLSFSMPWPQSAYRYELNGNPNSMLWVAEATPPDGGKQVVGMIVTWLILEEAHIATIAVHPDYRGKGIGRRLLITALKGAIRKGSQQATLEVRASNMVAQNLYRRFGFETVGNRPRYYRDNSEDAFIMTANHLGMAYLEWLESQSGEEIEDA